MYSREFRQLLVTFHRYPRYFAAPQERWARALDTASRELDRSKGPDREER